MADAAPSYAAITVRAAAAAQVFVDDPALPLLTEEDAHHLGRVLRLRAGEEVIASDGRGRWSRVTWQGGPEVVPVTGAAGVGGDGAVQSEPAAVPALTVAFAPVKGERPEWVVQKLTELGIDRIVPLLSERSVVRWSGARGKATVERLRRVAREAATQCRRVWLPEVTDVVRFGELPSLGGPGEVVLAQLSGDRPSVASHVVAVGPEGGWSTDELSSGLPTVGFGLSVLRAETAAVTAGALLASLRTGTVAAAEPAGTGVSPDRGRWSRSGPFARYVRASDQARAEGVRRPGMTDCLFCKIVAGEVPSDKVHETDTTLAFKDIHPLAPLHVLIVPKRHIDDASVVTAEDGPVLAEMLLAARAVADEAGLDTPERGYRLVFNIGPDAMNSVPHLHLHVLGGEPLKGHLLNS